MENNTCHICLEEHTINRSQLMKTCCNGYICNPCWGDIRNNPLLNKCPICGFIFPTRTTPLNENTIPTDTINSNIKLLFRRIFMILKWLSIGYFTTTVFILIISRNFEDTYEALQELTVIPYFWPLCILFGYLIVCIVEYGINRDCHLWYN